MGELFDMKITEHIYLLTLFGIVLMLLPMLGGSSMITVVTSRLWNDNIVFLFCVVALFYLGLLLNKLKAVDSKLINSCIALTLFFSVAVFLVSGSFRFEEILRFILVVLLIPSVDHLIKKYGVWLVGYLFIAIILFQSQWGLAQFIIQRDLGFYLLGESKLSSEMPGAAKFDFTNCVNDCEQARSEKTIRAYGPFQHANVFGGVMAIGLMTIVLLIMEAGINFDIQVTMKGRVILLSSIFFLFLGLLVSFSRSAYLATGIMLLIFGAVRFFSSKYRGIRKLFMAHESHSGRQFRVLRTLNNPYFTVPIILIVLFSPLLIARFTDREDVGIAERVEGASWAVALIRDNSWWQGVGPGAYRDVLRESLDQHGISYQPWQIDSVHSVPLLIAVEWGLLLSSILLLLLVIVMMKAYSKKWHWFIPFTPVILFDHYMITQTAPMVLVMIWALLLYHFRSTGKVGPEKL